MHVQRWNPAVARVFAPLTPQKKIEGFWWSLLHLKMFCRSRTDQRLNLHPKVCVLHHVILFMFLLTVNLFQLFFLLHIW